MDNLSNDIIKYKRGELTPEQMHAMEKRALSDPFLAEALEGIDSISSSQLVDDLSLLNQKILNKKKSIIFTPLRIAAGILLLAGSIFTVYQFIPKPETIALQTEKPEAENKIEEKEQPNAESKIESPKVESKNLKVEREKLKDESKLGNPESSERKAIGNQTNIAKQNSLSDSQSKDQETLSQAPSPSLAEVQHEANTEIADGKLKVTAEVEETAAGAKPLLLDEKKEAFANSATKRSTPSRFKTQLKKSISGQVVSTEDGSPLPGVNVTVQGTTTGTITDANGHFTIQQVASDQTLEFSFIDLTNQQIPINGKDTLDIALKTDVAQLSEVVVTGYGITTNNKDNDEPIIRLAEPVGGRKAYDLYLKTKLQYPKDALKYHIKGKATIQFTIGTDGILRNFKVIKKLGHGCEEEMIRLVNEGPRWSPTTEDSKPVESQVRVRLKFDPDTRGKEK